MRTTITVLAGIAVALLVLTGCGDNTVKSTSGVSSQPRIISAPAGDPRVLIPGLQQVLEPAGHPFTAGQQARITDVFHSPDDLRAAFGILTESQKRVIVDGYRHKLAGSAQPLTAHQETRLMAFGPGGPDAYWGDIITEEQTQIFLRKSMEERQRK